jgi:hypothetical protein
MPTIITREKLQGLVNITKRPAMFLRDTFFANSYQFDTETVRLDLDIEVRAVAEYNERGAVSKPAKKEPFLTNTYTPPYISLNQALTERDFANRIPGSTSENTPALSAKEWATVRGLQKLDNMISRREEFQCMEALFNGQITVGANTISFGRDNALNVVNTSGARWDQSTPDIYGQLVAWRDLVADKSGLPAGNIVMGLDAWKAMRASNEFMSLLDKLNVKIGEIAPQRIGVAYRVMTLGEIGDFWVYPEKYVDPADGQTKNLIPAKKIAYVAYNPGFTRLYGGVPTAQSGNLQVVAGERVVDYDIQKDPAQELIIMKSAPLMQLTNPNAVLSAQVID